MTNYQDRLNKLAEAMANGQSAVRVNQHNLDAVFIPLARIALEYAAIERSAGYNDGVEGFKDYMSHKMATTKLHHAPKALDQYLLTAGLVPDKNNEE